MQVFDGIDLDRLRLQRMHFHIIAPPRRQDEDFRLEELGDVDPEGFEDFFLERVRASRSGNEFVFNPQSVTLGWLRRLARSEDSIGNVASALARAFGLHHTKQMNAGVFMLLDVTHGQTNFYALLKFDDQAVLRFRGDHGRTVLEHLRRTFVEDERAMQKVAIARMQLRGDVPLLVLERSDRRNGTAYFRGFLDATRRFSDAELTQRTEQALRDAHAGLVGVVDREQLSGYLNRT